MNSSIGAKIKRNSLVIIIAIAFVGLLIANYLIPAAYNKFNEKSENVTESDFEAKALNNDMPSMVVFSAEWCNPCKVHKGIISMVMDDFIADVRFLRVDVDKEKRLANRYKVSILPTTYFFHKGKILGKFEGIRTSGEISGYLSRVKNGQIAADQPQR